jgi:type IV pilus assembly protein PilQ
MKSPTEDTPRAKNRFVAGLIGLLAMLAWPAHAAEIQSLAWEEGDRPALRIQMSGEASYTVETLEDGLRQRLSFSGSTMGKNLDELAGRANVKGVYPYLADNGTAVNIDLMLKEPGSLKVDKTASGLLVAVESAVAAAPVAAPESTPAEPPRSVAAANSIEEILYTKLPGDRVQVTLRMTKTPAEPSAFTITNPARISLDFPDTRVALARKTITVKEGALSNVTAVQAEGRTRVVLSLFKPVAYTTSVDGSNFVITLQAPATAAAGTAQPKTTRFATARKDARFSVSEIDFRRGPQGDGKVIVTLSDPSVGIDIREQAGEIVLDFLNTGISPELQRRLDVVDFATPVQTIDTFSHGRNTRMVIIPKGRYEHVAYQAGNVLTVSVKPIIEVPDEKKVDEFGYSGEKLSLNFQNIDVRAALQVLADFTGLNFVVSDTVKGNLTLRLKDVPWDQALDLIVESKTLAVRKKGNVISVAPAAEVAAREKAALEATKAVIELEPLVSELVRINYAKAEDLAALIKSIKPVSDVGAQQHPVFGAQATGQGAAIPQTATNTLLSPRGQVTVDARTNSLLIQDTPAKIRELRKLIAQLDQPVRQVMVETRLVEATEDYAKNLGARLAHLNESRKGQSFITTSGKIDVLPPLRPAGGGNPVYEIIPSGLNVNLAAAGVGGFSAGTFMVDFIKGGLELTLELSALEQSGQGKIISSPRVITANQKKALIEQGQERVFTTTVLGVGSVVTKKATLKLEVTPAITPDDRVNLDVKITKDNFEDPAAGLLNVKQLNTQVLLDNGETVVIGGIYEQEKQGTVTKVPFFGDLPLLGWLFRNKAELDTKTELLIFLTPRILSERLAFR